MKDIERVNGEDGSIAYEVELGNWLISWAYFFVNDGNTLSKERNESALEDTED